MSASGAMTVSGGSPTTLRQNVAACATQFLSGRQNPSEMETLIAGTYCYCLTDASARFFSSPAEVDAQKNNPLKTIEPLCEKVVQPAIEQYKREKK
jgi:hypothetical protein